MKRPSDNSPVLLGIDLVEIERAQRFYRRHRRRLSRFFTPTEVGFLSRHPSPSRALAILLGAKEAAFKALGGDWMGPQGFREIRIRARRDGSLEPRFTGRRPHPAARLDLTYSEHADHVVVRCRGLLAR